MALQVIPFNQAIEATEGTRRNLLIGNGFSIGHFNYSTLLDQAGLDADGPLRALFKKLDTVDFELVIRALEHASLVERTYLKEKRAVALQADAEKLRRALVHAIRWTHPANRDEILEEIPTCIEFLRQFGDVFTTNYDLLLYWVRLDNPREFADGFGLAEEEGGFRGPFSVEGHCNVFNLHGGLHIFQKSNGDVEKRIREPDGLIAAIGRTIAEDKRLPLYVAEGTSFGKLSPIYASPYLRHCYEKLCASEGPFFIYGLSASDRDAHIYDALFCSKI